MHQGRILFAALLIATAGCDEVDEPAGAPRTDLSASIPAGSETMSTAHLGAVTYRYDPAVLRAANVRIAIPPSEEALAYGTKLVPSRSVVGDEALCPGDVTDCPVELQPGVTLALLERPLASYLDALQDSEFAGRIRPTVIDDSQGVSVKLEPEDGFEVTYRFARVRGRTLAIKIQRDGENAAEDAAMSGVIGSIDLGN